VFPGDGERAAGRLDPVAHVVLGQAAMVAAAHDEGQLVAAPGDLSQLLKGGVQSLDQRPEQSGVHRGRGPVAGSGQPAQPVRQWDEVPDDLPGDRAFEPATACAATSATAGNSSAGSGLSPREFTAPALASTR
jgi:hypothetical protein